MRYESEKSQNIIVNSKRRFIFTVCQGKPKYFESVKIKEKSFILKSN